MLKSISSAARTLLKKQEMHNGSKSYLYNSGNAVWSDKAYSNFVENAYINNVIAHRAINMIAHAASSVPFKLYKLIDGKRHLITQHPVLELLNKPNPIQSGKEILEAIYTYQKNNSFQDKQLISDGIINRGGDTAKKIETELAE